MKKHKFISFFFALSFLLAGCGGNESDSNSHKNIDDQSTQTNTDTEDDDNEDNNDDNNLPKSINMSRAIISLFKDDTFQLSVTLENLTGTVYWTSTNESVATVTNDGLVYAVGEGHCSINATINGYSCACYVDVTDYTNKEYEVTFRCIDTVEEDIKVVFPGGTVLSKDNIPRFTPLEGFYIKESEYEQYYGIKITSDKRLTIYSSSYRYNLSFELDGGKFVDNQRVSTTFSYYDIERGNKFPEAVKSGYVFGGYYTEPTFEHLVEGYSDLPYSDVTLYTKFIEKSSHIRLFESFESYQKQEEPMMELEIKTGEYFPEVVVDFGYKINYVKNAKNNETFYTPYNGEIGSCSWYWRSEGESLDLYLDIAKIQYNIYYLDIPLEYREYFSDNEKVLRKYDIETNLELPKPVIPGIVVEGYYLDKDFTQPVTKIQNGINGKFENVWFYVKFVNKIVNLTYKFDDPVLDVTTQIESLHYKTLKCPQEGYDVYYYEDVDCTIPIDDVYPIDDDITVYCKRFPVQFQIDYYLDGGTNNGNNPDSFTIEEEIELKEPTKDLYAFDGWYLDEDFTRPISKIEKGTIGGIEVFAKWSEIGKTINYHLNCGENDARNSKNWYKDHETILYPASRENCTFAGWYFDANFTKEVTELSLKTIGKYEPVDIYAKFESENVYFSTSDVKGVVFNEENLTFSLTYDRYSMDIVPSIYISYSKKCYTLSKLTMNWKPSKEIKLPAGHYVLNNVYSDLAVNKYFIPKDVTFDPSILNDSELNYYFIEGHDEIDIDLINGKVIKNFKKLLRDDAALCEDKDGEYITWIPGYNTTQIPSFSGIPVKEILKGCLQLTNVDTFVIPGTVRKLQPGTFVYVAYVNKIVFEGGLKDIPSDFNVGDFETVKSIELQEGIETIGANAFDKYSGDLVLPDSIKYIGENGVGNAKIFTTKLADETNFKGLMSDKRAYSGYVKNKQIGDFEYAFYNDDEGQIAIIESYNGNDSTIKVPEEVEGYKVVAIDSYAFNKINTIEFIEFPATLHTIFVNAFYQCTMKHLIFLGDIDTFEPNAFNELRADLIICKSLLKDIKNVKIENYNINTNHIKQFVLKENAVSGLSSYLGIHKDYSSSFQLHLYQENESGIYRFDNNTNRFKLLLAKDNGTDTFNITTSFKDKVQTNTESLVNQTYVVGVDPYAFNPLYSSNYKTINLMPSQSTYANKTFTLENKSLYKINVENFYSRNDYTNFPNKTEVEDCLFECNNLKDYEFGIHALHDGIHLSNYYSDYKYIVDDFAISTDSLFYSEDLNFLEDENFRYVEDSHGRIIIDYIGGPKDFLNFEDEVYLITDKAIESINRDIKYFIRPRFRFAKNEILDKYFTPEVVSGTLIEEDEQFIFQMNNTTKDVLALKCDTEMVLNKYYNDFCYSVNLSDNVMLINPEKLVSVYLLDFEQTIGIKFKEFVNLKYVLCNSYQEAPYQTPVEAFSGTDGITFYLNDWYNDRRCNQEEFLYFLSEASNYKLIFIDIDNLPPTLIPVE